MDLSLPDLSGYELLEQMAEQDDVSFPPVIVYTGRVADARRGAAAAALSRKSIIIKDARSPERLLDEVTLFLHQVEATLPPERQRMLQAARDREAALEGRRILVVEDDVRNIFALSSVLEPKGAKVEIARNGREALEALDAQPGRSRRSAIDLVLMDIMMPEMDGLDRDARDPQAPGVEEAADHRAHREGDEATTRRSASPPAPTTTSPSRSTSRSCCRWCGSGCRSSETVPWPPRTSTSSCSCCSRRSTCKLPLRLPRLRAAPR